MPFGEYIAATNSDGVPASFTGITGFKRVYETDDENDSILPSEV